MHLLRAGTYKRMPWKNGGGETVEIAVFPPGACVEDFDWRVSMATVANDGPFSLFPGIDRTLSVLAGNGIAMEMDGRPPVALTRHSPPLSFAADVPVFATLDDGPITDLNVMTRRGVARHSVARGACPCAIETVAAGTTVIALALDAMVARLDGEGHRLEPLDAILVEGGRSIRLEAENGQAAFYRIAIDIL